MNRMARWLLPVVLVEVALAFRVHSGDDEDAITVTNDTIVQDVLYPTEFGAEVAHRPEETDHLGNNSKLWNQTEEPYLHAMVKLEASVLETAEAHWYDFDQLPAHDLYHDRTPASELETAEAHLYNFAQYPTHDHYLDSAPADWWKHLDMNDLGRKESQFNSVVETTELLGVVIRRYGTYDTPWKNGEEIYHWMGMRDPSFKYFAAWVSLGDKSLVMLSKITDVARFDNLWHTPDFLHNRVKLVIKGPFPSKSPSAAATMGSFFGQGAVHQQRTVTESGIEISVVRVNIFASRLVRWGWSMGVRQGTEVDFLFLDWDGRSVLSGCHLTVTPTAQGLLK